MNDRLLPQHERLIAGSAIAPDVAEARGYFSARTKRELADLGFSHAQQRVPALVIPIHDPFGEVALHQIRADQPRAGTDGRPRKYEFPAKARMVLDVPPAVR